LRRDTTDPERKLWWHLRQIELPHSHFRRQAAIGPYFADFACHDQRVVIEVDGDTHAGTSAADNKRTRYMQANGYRVLRFSNAQIMSEIEGVLTVICAAIQADGLPPLTPPYRSQELAGGGEP
jgi:very-short-patch-repair endonuclease